MQKKSTMKSLGSIWILLAEQFNTDPRTIQSFKKRFEGEGIPFLTSSLPVLGKSFEAGFVSTYKVDGPFSCKRGSVLPEFMYEFFRLVYDDQGELLAYPNIDKVREIRQLLLVFYKLEIDITPEGERLAIQKFKDTDAMVKTGQWSSDIITLREKCLSLFEDFDPFDINPRHSNGATADGANFLQKRIFSSSRELEELFSLNDLISTQPYCYDGNIPSYSKVTFVPKDSRGPRTICMEPHTTMFIGLGIMESLYSYLENHTMTRNKVNFTDQRKNRWLAQLGSLTGKYATIDLKDASDLVSNDLVERIFPRDMVAAFKAVRSPVARVGNEEIQLKKFAPMGSALCFPIEAVIFFLICTLITDDVCVFGDDIIVPADNAIAVMDKLESFGLVVNRGKSFIHGPFRESCGGDYFEGQCVNIVRYKKHGLSSYIEFCNHISAEFDHDLASDLIQLRENAEGIQIYRRPLSFKDEGESLTFYTDRLASSSVFFKRRWNENLHRYEHRVMSSSTKVVSGYIDEDVRYTETLRGMLNSVTPALDYIGFEHREPGNNSPLDHLGERSSLSITRADDIKRLVTTGYTKPAIKFVWRPVYSG